MKLPGFDRVTSLSPWPHGEHHGKCELDGSIVLHPDDYAYLRMLGAGWRPRNRVQLTLAAMAVLLLAHELGHRHGAVGVENATSPQQGAEGEKQATRYALKEYVRICRRLGVGRVLALRMRLLVRGAFPT